MKGLYLFDLNIIKAFYEEIPNRISDARKLIDRPLTLTEKILYSHLNKNPSSPFDRGKSYVEFHPDRVAMKDATAQMALLQFMMSGKNKVSVPSTVHCDHLIQAKIDAKADLMLAQDINNEVYDFLESVSNKYGLSLIHI